ncbi:hypothetical protein BS47DRAFT_1369542 [Hydnum rufescens UP504]|uniref:Uncharacterized protein n=1 Tax=Hydnum rufescens UP504 TaxID=1448309 RepID=A0A9P6ACK2_9AGAM|nr:hypothetical protein BS47DRAFT_1369542 [Hydnum rufescens UP504]
MIRRPSILYGPWMFLKWPGFQAILVRLEAVESGLLPDPGLDLAQSLEVKSRASLFFGGVTTPFEVGSGNELGWVFRRRSCENRSVLFQYTAGSSQLKPGQHQTPVEKLSTGVFEKKRKKGSKKGGNTLVHSGSDVLIGPSASRTNIPLTLRSASWIQEGTRCHTWTKWSQQVGSQMGGDKGEEGGRVITPPLALALGGGAAHRAKHWLCPEHRRKGCGWNGRMMKDSKVVTGQVAQSLPKERKGIKSQGTSPEPGKGLVLMATRGQQDIQIEAAETRDKRQEGSWFSLGVEVWAKDNYSISASAIYT